MSETTGDSIPKTMLILKSQSAVLGAVEAFLRNRGWKIYSTTNLKEALVQLVSQKPSYILISIDHANKKVRALPKLLASVFPVAIIVFAETQSSSAYKTLNESATDYRVYPPLTGPAIERCVNKYLKDQQTKLSVQANDSFRSENNTQSGNDTISIKGGANAQNLSKGTGSEFGSDNVSRLLSQFLGEEAGNIALTTPQKPDNNLVFAQTSEEESATPGANFIPDPANGFGQTYVQKGSAGNIGTYVPPTEGSQGSGSTQSPASQGAEYSGTQEGDVKKPLNEGLGSREYRRSQAGSSWVPMDNKEYSQHIRERRARSDANETLIARGAQWSLEESAEIRDGAVKNQIEEATSAACIVVESARFSGYLVAVMGNNREIDEAFIESVKGKLFKFLNENGEEVAKNDSLDIKIKQVDFEPWALEYADFLRKSVHQGNEVAMAFFPRAQIKANLEDSNHKDMAKIQFNELQGNRQVEFDLYVYLPNNNKYVLYTPKGGVFYDKQMDRLKKQGVTHMHVQRDAAAAIAKYQAQNYLNDMIEDHGQKQEAVLKMKSAS